MLEMKSKPQLITRDYWIGRWRDDPNDAEWDRAPRRPAEVRPGRRDRLGDQLHCSLRVETDVRGASSTIRGAGIGFAPGSHLLASEPPLAAVRWVPSAQVRSGARRQLVGLFAGDAVAVAVHVGVLLVDAV